jgi:NAD(P)-dependent dehydrogenase (short-subunit alcohol dehydrogenase family)
MAAGRESGMQAGARFRGKVVVVTGAASGIGFASARRFAHEGANVALVDVDAGALEPCLDLLADCEGDVAAWPVDVADELQVADAFAAIVARFGHIDVLHANAGILLPAGVEEETLERFRRTLDVNVGGVFLTCRAALPFLRQCGGGSIVTTGSISGMVAEPAFLGYCTSKAAVNHLTRQIALDYANQHIRVNAVCPGWIDTPFNHDLLAPMATTEVDAAVRAVVPMERQGTADEVAAAVAFLASNDASYITGHCLVVDGGYTLR